MLSPSSAAVAVERPKSEILSTAAARVADVAAVKSASANSKMSAPAPPVKRSAPIPPVIISAPAPPLIVSAFPGPVKISLPLEPVIVRPTEEANLVASTVELVPLSIQNGHLRLQP